MIKSLTIEDINSHIDTVWALFDCHYQLCFFLHRIYIIKYIRSIEIWSPIITYAVPLSIHKIRTPWMSWLCKEFNSYLNQLIMSGAQHTKKALRRWRLQNVVKNLLHLKRSAVSYDTLWILLVHHQPLLFHITYETFHKIATIISMLCQITGAQGFRRSL